MPLSQTLSTYMYVLGLEDKKYDACKERDIVAKVATLHDALYKPTVKTTTLLIKSLVSCGNVVGAASLLSTIANGPLSKTLRHRTTSPLLQLYCAKGEIGSVLRLYHKMRKKSRAKMDTGTYADFITAVVDRGYFGKHSECIVGAENSGYYNNQGEEVGGDSSGGGRGGGVWCIMNGYVDREDIGGRVGHRGGVGKGAVGWVCEGVRRFV